MLRTISGALLFAFLLALSGCVSMAGPYVTDIHANEHGDLIIEKCDVESSYNGQFSSIRTGRCSSFLLKLSEVKRGPKTTPEIAPETPPEVPPEAPQATSEPDATLP